MALSPRASGRLICDLSTHVKIKEDGIVKLGNILVEEINSGRLSVENFSQNGFHPKPEDPWALDWLFVVDTLNFCFWHPQNREGWVVQGNSGYFALCAAINRALKENVDILNPRFYSKMTKEQLLQVLRSDTNTQIPLLQERLQSLHEVGACLLEKFNGSFENCVKQANNSALKLLQIITENFKCFCDDALYKGHKVSFYKRAQILVGDIWSCYRNSGVGHFTDIDEITMFADYRVPQSLLYHGVLEYSQELMAMLKSDTVLKNGSEMEVEIRGCSIHAVELLKEHAQDKVNKEKVMNSILIDHFLWEFRRKHNKEIMKLK